MSAEEAADREIERSQSEPFDPPYQAYMMRVEGYPWSSIAQQCGYKSEVSAAIAVKGYLQSAAIMASNERKREAVAMEEARYDKLQQAWWYAATHGDDKAANIVLKIMSQRAKLKQLEEPESSREVKTNTILVMGDKSSYANKLQEIVEGKHETEDEEED